MKHSPRPEKTPKTPGSSAKKIGKNSFLYSKIFPVNFIHYNLFLFYNSNCYNFSEAAKKFSPAPGEWSRDILKKTPGRASLGGGTPGRAPILEAVDFSQSDLYVHQRSRRMDNPLIQDPSHPPPEGEEATSSETSSRRKSSTPRRFIRHQSPKGVSPIPKGNFFEIYIYQNIL